MEFTQISNPVWANSAHTRINCLVTFAELGELPFTADPNDAEPHSQKIFAAIVNGDAGPVAEFVAPPTPVPHSVTMRQARLALLNAGLLTTINSAIAALPGTAGDAARIDWEFSSEVLRTSTTLQALAPILGLSSAQIDALFIAASQIGA